MRGIGPWTAECSHSQLRQLTSGRLTTMEARRLTLIHRRPPSAQGADGRGREVRPTGRSPPGTAGARWRRSSSS